MGGFVCVFVGDFVSGFTGDFVGGFTGDFVGGFIGDFVGDLVVGDGRTQFKNLTLIFLQPLLSLVQAVSE
jgi:hypothetical protein